MKPTMPILSHRHLFNIPDEVAYLNCAYNAPQLNESLARLLKGAAEKSHPWKRTPLNFFEDAETIRCLAASIFGGDVDGYAVVPAASYGLSTAARAIEPKLRNGDSILVMAEEFPSNVLPWRRVAYEKGATIQTVSSPEDGNWTQAILSSIDRRPKVVAISTCHWTNGSHIDLQVIADAVREVDGILVVDATQTLGAMPFSVSEVQPDFLVAAGYKWLLCPYGFGLLYVSEQWRNARPLEETWLARSNAEDFTALVNYSDSYLPGARKFDVGEKCTATILPGAIAALEQIKTWSVEYIKESLSSINSQIASRLDQLGFELPPASQRCPHILGCKVPKTYSGNLVAELKSKDIYISQRGSSLRFAPHMHVNENDLVRLFETLERLTKK